MGDFQIDDAVSYMDMYFGVIVARKTRVHTTKGHETAVVTVLWTSDLLGCPRGGTRKFLIDPYGTPLIKCLSA